MNRHGTEQGVLQGRLINMDAVDKVVRYRRRGQMRAKIHTGA